MSTHRLALVLASLGLALAACGRDSTVLVGSSEPQPTLPGAADAPPANQGPATGGSGGSGTTGACATDCDCGPGTACVAGSGGELTSSACVPGANTCPRPCVPDCGASATCVGGQCVALKCPDQLACNPGQFCDVNGSCQALPPRISVAGTWKTTYRMDISEFARQSSELLAFLDLLQAILGGQGSCASQSTPEGQLLCVFMSSAMQGFQAPPWLSQLISVLSDLFRFGNHPVTAAGLMVVQDHYDTVSATESWTSLKMQYQGQVLDLMTSPVLGSAGNVTVTVNPFGGTRDALSVYFGPRDVDLDVNKLILALLDVAISAATNGQATDVEGLLDLLLCDNVPFGSSSYLLCLTAANSLAGNLELGSGLGGFHFDRQDAPIFDDDGDGVADHLARPSTQGLLKGDLSNGLVSGDLGPAPGTGWYGER